MAVTRCVLPTLGILSMILTVTTGITVTICTGSIETIRCGADQYIHVTRAKYARGWFSRMCGSYWLPCNGADVLNRVRNICGPQSSTCRLEPSTRLFGDPCRWSEHLILDYECKEKPTPQTTTTASPYITIRICERFSRFIGCPQGKLMNIISAFYGRKSADYCPTGDISNTNCFTDASRYAKFYAQGKGMAGITASDAHFGDPCPGISKYLEIIYECKDAEKPTPQTTTAAVQQTTTASPYITIRICERFSRFIACPQGKLMNIISAFYGRKSADYCPTGDISNTNCFTDASRYAKFYAQGKGMAGITASDAHFGDPCPGISKYLEIIYECKDAASFSTLPPTTSRPPLPTGANTPTAPPIPPGTCGVSQISQSRIIGGTAARRGAWPWQVALYRKGEFQCGGSLIDPAWVVTATHCVEKINGGGDSNSDYHVVLGDHDRSVSEGTEMRRQLQRIILHPNYNMIHKYNNDIALLKLDRPLLLSAYISPVCLPDQDQNIPVGTACFISGWGMTQYPSNPSDLLQQGLLPIVSKQECIKRLHTSNGNEGLSISDEMLCAGFRDNSSAPNSDLTTCRGDSGGPLVCQESSGKWILHGVTSWGSIRCSGMDRYSVYAKVSKFRNWIDGIIGNNGAPPPQPPSL